MFGNFYFKYMAEIEFIEKYMFICDKDGNKSHIKLIETQKRFLEYVRKCNVKSSFAFTSRIV